MTSDDSAWRRPEAAPARPDQPWAHPARTDPPRPSPPDPPRPSPNQPSRAPTRPDTSGYPGPPRTVAPPAGWRPPVVYQPPPPRDLPAQDLPAIDAAEREARTVTYGVGLVAGALMLLLLFVLCGRLLF